MVKPFTRHLRLHALLSCWVFIAFVKDITSDLSALATAIKSTDTNRIDVKQRFGDIIKLYLDVKQLSEDK